MEGGPGVSHGTDTVSVREPDLSAVSQTDTGVYNQSALVAMETANNPAA